MNEPYSWVAPQYLIVKDKISEFCLKSDRKIEDISLMVVTKTHPWIAIEKAYKAGARLFGENRAQEMLARIPDPWPFKDAELAFIGHLQSNKIKKIVHLVNSIQSLDDVSHLSEVNKHAELSSKKIEIWLEMNTSGEISKSGMKDYDGLSQILGNWNYPHLEIKGLMTIGPLGNDEVRIGKAFASLRTFAERAKTEFGLKELKLSMGMSDDFHIAIKEGSNLIRIGTAIFGERS